MSVRYLVVDCWLYICKVPIFFAGKFTVDYDFGSILRYRLLGTSLSEALLIMCKSTYIFFFSLKTVISFYSDSDCLPRLPEYSIVSLFIKHDSNSIWISILILLWLLRHAICRYICSQITMDLVSLIIICLDSGLLKQVLFVLDVSPSVTLDSNL